MVTANSIQVVKDHCKILQVIYFSIDLSGVEFEIIDL